jgi:hypothetical protein
MNTRIVSPSRIWAARALAVAADAIQIFAVPAFFGGIASPLNDALDVVVGVVLILLVGWHITFLPTFIAELIPMVDLAPTWTVAVLFATRGRKVTPGA